MLDFVLHKPTWNSSTLVGHNHDGRQKKKWSNECTFRHKRGISHPTKKKNRLRQLCPRVFHGTEPVLCCVLFRGGGMYKKKWIPLKNRRHEKKNRKTTHPRPFHKKPKRIFWVWQSTPWKKTEKEIQQVHLDFAKAISRRTNTPFWYTKAPHSFLRHTHKMCVWKLYGTNWRDHAGRRPQFCLVLQIYQTVPIHLYFKHVVFLHWCTTKSSPKGAEIEFQK